jgi:hypothetical protein
VGDPACPPSQQQVLSPNTSPAELTVSEHVSPSSYTAGYQDVTVFCRLPAPSPFDSAPATWRHCHRNPRGQTAYTSAGEQQMSLSLLAVSASAGVSTPTPLSPPLAKRTSTSSSPPSPPSPLSLLLPSPPHAAMPLSLTHSATPPSLDVPRCRLSRQS